MLFMVWKGFLLGLGFSLFFLGCALRFGAIK